MGYTVGVHLPAVSSYGPCLQFSISSPIPARFLGTSNFLLPLPATKINSTSPGFHPHMECMPLAMTTNSIPFHACGLLVPMEGAQG